jgi:hypothetical protein
LPIAFPLNITSCDGSGDAVNSGTPWLLDTYYVIPLCKNTNATGNVGWLDLNDGSVAGLPSEILQPVNSLLNSPTWWNDPIPGNTNKKPVEDALRTLDGHTVRALQFDHTCNGATNSTIPAINTGPSYGCASGLDASTGANTSYRLTAVGFTLCDPSNVDCPLPHGSYVNGNNSTICGTGNGSTGCIVGKFVDVSEVPGAGVGGSGDTSPVQLIR